MKSFHDYSANDFLDKTASAQNAADLFKGEWVSQVPTIDTGEMALFAPEDDRPGFVVSHYGSIQDWSVLELGSFEGGHAYQLEQAGANVIGIEANPHIFVRSLIAKNALGMKTKFLLGDFHRYIDGRDRFDIIFCSGVLYHMPDPVGLIERMSKATDRVFIWTHYVDDENMARWDVSGAVSDYTNGDFSCCYYRYDYATEWASRSFAGVKPFASRLRADAIFSALKHFGFVNIKICKDEPNHPGGAAFSLIAER